MIADLGWEPLQTRIANAKKQASVTRRRPRTNQRHHEEEAHKTNSHTTTRTQLSIATDPLFISEMIVSHVLQNNVWSYRHSWTSLFASLNTDHQAQHITLHYSLLQDGYPPVLIFPICRLLDFGTYCQSALLLPKREKGFNVGLASQD